MFTNPSPDAIRDLLQRARTIAVVGLSAKPDRPSYRVAHALQSFGYHIVPVNPAAETILGERVAPDLEGVRALLAPDETLDIVDVFRQPAYVAATVEDCIRLGVPALWLQDGVIDEAAALRAQAAGIFTVMDRCIYRDRSRLSF